MKDRALNDKEVKIKWDIEQLFFKWIIVSTDYMNKFEEEKMKKKRTIKDTWYDWLINFIPEPIRKSESGFKDKVVSLFKINAPKQTLSERGKKLQHSTENRILIHGKLFNNYN